MIEGGTMHSDTGVYGIYLLFSYSEDVNELYVTGVHPGPRAVALAEATVRAGVFVSSYAVDFSRPLAGACEDLRGWLEDEVHTAPAEADGFIGIIVEDIDRIRAEFEAGYG